MPNTPIYQHDCPDCQFLSRSADEYADLYFCPAQERGFRQSGPTVIARYGSLKHQMVLGLEFATPAGNPWLLEAKLAAQKRKLLSED